MNQLQTKALEVLTRCGHFSGQQANQLLEQLEGPELDQLAKMFDALMAAEAVAADKTKQPGKKRPALTEAEKAAVAEASAVGEQFRAWRDAVEDRLNPPPKDDPAEVAVDVVTVDVVAGKGEQLSSTTTVSVADGTLKADPAVPAVPQGTPAVVAGPVAVEPVASPTSKAAEANPATTTSDPGK